MSDSLVESEDTDWVDCFLNELIQENSLFLVWILNLVYYENRVTMKEMEAEWKRSSHSLSNIIYCKSYNLTWTWLIYLLWKLQRFAKIERKDEFKCRPHEILDEE